MSPHTSPTRPHLFVGQDYIKWFYVGVLFKSLTYVCTNCIMLFMPTIFSLNNKDECVALMGR